MLKLLILLLPERTQFAIFLANTIRQFGCFLLVLVDLSGNGLADELLCDYVRAMPPSSRETYALGFARYASGFEEDSQAVLRSVACQFHSRREMCWQRVAQNCGSLPRRPFSLLLCGA